MASLGIGKGVYCYLVETRGLSFVGRWKTVLGDPVDTVQPVTEPRSPSWVGYSLQGRGRSAGSRHATYRVQCRHLSRLHTARERAGLDLAHHLCILLYVHLQAEGTEVTAYVLPLIGQRLMVAEIGHLALVVMVLQAQFGNDLIKGFDK